MFSYTASRLRQIGDDLEKIKLVGFYCYVRVRSEVLIWCDWCDWLETVIFVYLVFLDLLLGVLLLFLTIVALGLRGQR